MPSNPQPEILPPQKSRFQKANGLFADENLDLLSHVLDDWFRVPGTSIRFGLDGIIGLVPGLGDIIGGLASTIIVVAAWVRGVPYVTLLRMVVNIGIEVLLGTIPLLGDAFAVIYGDSYLPCDYRSALHTFTASGNSTPATLTISVNPAALQGVPGGVARPGRQSSA